MKPIRHKVYGRLLPHPRQTAVWLQTAETPGAAPLYLAYALTLQGVESPIFPALLLDDWGNEIAKLALYDWLGEHGDLFPRATVFGFEADGRETQCFVRGLELHWKYPCYVYPQRETAVADGVPVAHMLMTDDERPAVEPIKPPADRPLPLRRARVRWWTGPAALLAAFDPDAAP